MLDTRQLTVRRHLAASEAAERATADRMLPTDEERDQAFRRVFLDCLANALATKTIFVFQAHGDSFPSETEQDGRLQSVPFPLSFLPPNRLATLLGAAHIYANRILQPTFRPSEWVCVLPYITSFCPYFSLAVLRSTPSFSARCVRARSLAAIHAVKADSEAEFCCQHHYDRSDADLPE